MSKAQKYCFFSLFSFAFIIRLITAINFNGFTFDEMVSSAVSQKPLLEMWTYLKWEMHPPAHYIFLHIWSLFFGASEISLRLSGLFLSLLVLVFLFILSKKIFSSVSSALAGCYIFAVSPILVFYSVWIRMQTMFLLLSIISFWLFFILIKKLTENTRPGVWLTAFYVLSTLLALYTHLTALIILGVQFLYCLYFGLSKKIEFKRLIKFYLMPNILIAVLYIPWFLNFLFNPYRNLKANAWYFYDQAGPFFFFKKILGFITEAGVNFPAFIGLAAILILFLFSFLSYEENAGFKKIVINLNRGKVLTWIIFLVSFSLLCAAGLYQTRYYILPALGFILIIGSGLNTNIINKKERILFVVLIFFLALPSLIYIARMPSNYWPEASRFILNNEKIGDKIITAHYNHLLFLEKYYQGNLPFDSVLDKNKKENDLLLTIIKNNYYPSVNENNVNQLDELTAGNSRIFLIFTEGDFSQYQKIARDWLIGNHWQIDKQLYAGKISSSRDVPNVWLLTKK